MFRTFYFWKANARIEEKPDYTMTGIMYYWFWQSRMNMRKDIVAFLQLELTRTCTIKQAYESKVLVTDIVRL